MEHKTLQDARLAVMREVPYLKKRSSEHLNYTFAGEADLIAKLRPSMLEHGISVRCSAIENAVAQEYTTAKGSRMLLRSGQFTFEFSCNGETALQTVFAEAADSADKAGGKMQTMALKYALRQFFLIETGDDPDEVVAERGTPQEGHFRTALIAINNAKDEKALDGIIERVHVSETANFSDEQKGSLDAAAERRRAALKNPKMNGGKR